MLFSRKKHQQIEKSTWCRRSIQNERSVPGSGDQLKRRMVSSTIESLNNVKLDKASQDDQYTDITQLLFTKAQKLKVGTVVKSPSFSLFEGTHALEVTNDKLDSGLIELSEDELQFDFKKGRSLKEVLHISDYIFRSVFVWLNNASLPVTVFSCRYVENILVNYTNNIRGGLSSCKFYDPKETIEQVGNVENQLVHKVLRSVVLGVLHFVRLSLTLGQSGVVYEEEDINTQNMNLDVLSLIGSDQVLGEIISSINFLSKHFAGEKDAILITNILQILKKLIDLPFFLSVKIPRNSNGKTVNVEVLDSLLRNCALLQQNLDYLNSLDEIPGLFSLGIQKRLDNRSPTRSLISPNQEDYSSLELMLKDFKQIFDVRYRSDILELKNYTLNFANKSHHTVSRAFFPLFLIRDDRSVLGDEQFDELLMEDLLTFTCCDAALFNTDNLVAKNKVNGFMEQMNIAYFEWYSAMSQNPCRQRQHFSRAIVLFDTLQANSEELEMELENVFQIKDHFEDEQGNSIPALPISSWVYYQKLFIMLQVVLRGFELDVYKLWEYQSMYWYASYLIDHIEALLNRITQYNNYKIESIKDMSKKLKKKTGEQKARYKEKYHFKLENILPILERTNEVIKNLIIKNQIFRGICHLQLYNLETLTKNGYVKTPDFPFIKDDSILYDLRMKPFSTVGVPSCPTFDDFTREIQHISITKEKANEIKTTVLEQIKYFVEEIEKDNKSIGMRLNKLDWINWFKELQKSTIGITLTSIKNQEATSPSDYRAVVSSEGFHRYFPLVKVEAKK